MLLLLLNHQVERGNLVLERLPLKQISFLVGGIIPGTYQYSWQVIPCTSKFKTCFGLFACALSPKAAYGSCLFTD